MPGGSGSDMRPIHAAGVQPPTPARQAAPSAERLVRPPFSLYQWTVLVLLVITISRVHSHFGFLRALRPALLLAAGAVLLAFMNPVEMKLRPMLRTREAKIILTIAGIAAISVFLGISQGAAAFFIINVYSRVLLFALLLAAAVRTGRDLYRYVWGYVIASAILVWMALFVFGLSQAYGSYVSRLQNLYTYDSNDLGVVLLVGLPLAALAAQVSRGYSRWAAIVIVIGIGAAVARTGSRGAFIGIVVVGAALLLIVKGVSVMKRVLFVAVAGISLVVMAPPGYWEQMRTLTQPTDDYNWSSQNGRKQIAKRGLGYMLRYPVAGVGINNFGRAEGTISDKAKAHVLGTGLHWTAAHNTYVQIGAELGVVAFVLWLWLMIGGIYYMLRLRRGVPRSWAGGNTEQRFLYFAPAYFAVAVLAFAVTSAFVSFAYLDLPYVLTVFMAGLVISLRRALAPGSARAVTARPARDPRRQLRPAV